MITFPVELPAGTSAEELAQWLSASGFTRVQAEREVATPTGPRKVLDVVADRFRMHGAEKARVVEAIEVALKRGSGRLTVYALTARGGRRRREIWKFSTGLHCPESDIRYADPIPSMFSFNSAVGACETCRGFGRVIGVDYGLVIPERQAHAARRRDQDHPDAGLEGSQDDLMRHAETAGIPRDTPWYKLTPEQQALGDRRHAQLQGRQLEQAVVRHPALLRVPGEQGLQDAHPRALVEVPQLHAVRDLRRRAPEDREPAVAHRQQGRRRRGAGAGQALHAGGRASGRASSWRPCRACACTT